MRSLRRLALLLPVVCFLPLACEDSDTGGGGTFNPEAGPGFEASAPVEAGLTDGAVPDSSVPDSATPKGVTVTVTDGLVTPKTGVRVIFHDATGLVTGQAMTDATGKVTVATAPSMVTVLTSQSVTQFRPVTFMGVADGDNLRVISPPTPIVEEPTIGFYAVTFTTGGVIANANGFLITAGSCSAFANDPAATTQVELYASCASAQNAVLTTASTNGTLAGFGFTKNVAKPAANATANVGPQIFTAPGATTLKATNLPASQSFSKRARLTAIATSQPFDISSATGAIDDAAGLTFPTPTGFADAYQAAVSYGMRSTDTYESTLVRREATTAPAGPTTLAAFDFTTAFPLMTQALVSNQIPARPEVTMTLAAALNGADAGLVALIWNDFQANVAGRWTFVIPPGVTTFKAPVLPADAVGFAPTVNSNTEIEQAAFFDASQVPSFALAKALPVPAELGLDFISTSLPLPAAGTLRITSWGERNR